MKPSQKALSDLAKLLDGPDTAQAETPLQKVDIEHFLGFLPSRLLDEIRLVFGEKLSTDPERAKAWLIATAGILLKDYDGSPLSHEEWEELRDMIADYSGELDMDTLSYAMALIMEHKAL